MVSRTQVDEVDRMSFVLLHGAIGNWDETLAAVGAVAILFGLTYIFSRRKAE
jgi:hypothetical protein